MYVIITLLRMDYSFLELANFHGIVIHNALDLFALFLYLQEDIHYILNDVNLPFLRL